MTTIAVDAMGGLDPRAVIGSVARATLRRSVQGAAFFTLVGDERRIAAELVRFGHNPERLSVVHAPGPERCGSEHDAASIACRLVADGAADAVVSAGRPPDAVRAAERHFKLLAGVRRPALAAVYPAPRRRRSGETQPFNLLLDVGASLRAEADDLVAFAEMGAAYARIVGGLETPRVALLSTARAISEGPPQIVRARDALTGRGGMRFVGCIEGDDLARAGTDVVVCEGFAGDVVHKLLGGVADAVVELARAAYDQNFFYRQGLRLLRGGLAKIKHVVDYEGYAGAPLLGYYEPMILVRSDAKESAFTNALSLAMKNARGNLGDQINAALMTPFGANETEEE